MEQEFFASFGKDELGTIGCDALINQHDFDGVNFIAIQALEKRTSEQTTKMEQLQKENQDLKARLAKLEMLLVNKR